MLHIRIEGDGQQGDYEGHFYACIDRHSRTARLLTWDAAALEQACILLKSLGAEAIEARLTPASVADLEAVGFTEHILYAVRRLDGKAVTRPASSMPLE